MADSVGSLQSCHSFDAACVVAVRECHTHQMLGIAAEINHTKVFIAKSTRYLTAANQCALHSTKHSFFISLLAESRAPQSYSNVWVFTKGRVFDPRNGWQRADRLAQ